MTTLEKLAIGKPQPSARSPGRRHLSPMAACWPTLRSRARPSPHRSSFALPRYLLRRLRDERRGAWGTEAGTTPPPAQVDAAIDEAGASAIDGGHPATTGNDDSGAINDAGAAIDDSSVADASPGDAADPSFAVVGVTTRTFVDPTRPTPANGTAAAQTSRTLVTEIWYPTLATGISPVRDAPIAPGGPFPLVFFVHGSGSSRVAYTYLTIALAQAGYLVAAADFPLTALGTAGGSSDLYVWYQVGDLSFLCDQLKATSADAGDDELGGAVDGLSYAVVGHSTGGAVAELAAFAGDDSMITHDSRVAAIVPLSGDACMFSAPFFESRAVPTFVIGASNDLFVHFPNSGEWVYDSTSEPHVAAKLIGGQHIYFTDFTFLQDSELDPVPTGPTSDLAVTLRAYGDAGECLPEPEAGTDPPLAPATQHALVIQFVTAYLDAEMRHNPAGMAAVEAANNPVVVLQQ
jgi:predicted dienelactone hydrolase